MAAPVGDTPKSTNYSGKNYLLPFAAVTFIFFIFGFITSVNDILTPYLQKMFSLSNLQASLVQATFFIAFFFVALPAGYLTKRIGYKKGMLMGLAAVAIGVFGFSFASQMPVYAIYLSFLFLLAGGITMLQVTANPYVTILGPESGASSRLNLSQAFNSVGTVVGPALWSFLFLPDDENAKMSADDMILPYAAMGVILIATILLIRFLDLPPIVNEDNEKEEAASKKKGSIWQYPHLILAAVGIFVYVGAEVTIGNNIVRLLSEDNVMGLSEKEAGYLVSFYWGGAMVGRFIGSALLLRMNAGSLLGICALLASAFLLIVSNGEGYAVVVTVLSIGLFNSIMFPNIFSMGIKGLGRFTEEGTSILIMSIVGGAAFPVLQGLLADRVGIQMSYLFPIISYLYIAYFGFKGHKAGRNP